MFENYTGKAARVLKQAEKASRELGQNYTGTEHILLAMLREKDCAAAQLLIERKVEEEKVLELIRDLISPEGGAALLTVELTPIAFGTRLVMNQQAPGFTTEQRLGTIAGWQTFLDVLGEIAAH